jgi:hypothetical protein
LAEDAIKPWQYRSWIFLCDPDFATKAVWVSDRYQGMREAELLGPDHDVISAEEKLQLQALSAVTGAGPRPGPGWRSPRSGTAPWRTSAHSGMHHARLIGHVAPITGIAPFAVLIDKVMDRRAIRLGPTGVLGGRSRLVAPGRASLARIAAAWPTATLVPLRVRFCWLYQIVSVYPVIQRKVIKSVGFADVDDLAAALVAFEARDTTTATAFDWTFTSADLADRCRRIDAHPGRRSPRPGRVG